MVTQSPDKSNPDVSIGEFAEALKLQLEEIQFSQAIQEEFQDEIRSLICNHASESKNQLEAFADQIESLKQDKASDSQNEQLNSLAPSDHDLAELKKLVDVIESENRELREENNRIRMDALRGADFLTENEAIAQLQAELEKTKHDLLQAQNEKLQSTVVQPANDDNDFWEAEKRKLLGDAAEDANEMHRDDLSAQGNDAESEEWMRELQSMELRNAEQAKRIEQLEALLNAELEVEISSEERERQQSVINDDEIIAVQRQRLKKLEDEWREKIGEAEIELSKERAKLARERAEVEQKSEELEQRLSRLELNSKSKVGKWRERLGL